MRSLACAFVDDVDNAGNESLQFAGTARDHIVLAAPGAVQGLCIWVSVQAQADEPLQRLALSLRAHGREVDWITYDGAAVAPPAGWKEATYTIDHIFTIAPSLTWREGVFELVAATEQGPLGMARLRMEFAPPF